MNVFASLHPALDTELRISRSEADSANFFRALVIGGCSIMPASADQARRMAVLLNQIARELEAQDDASR